MSNQVRGIKARQPQQIERYSLFYQIYTQQLDYEDLQYRFELPRDMFVVAYHRRFIKKNEFLFS